MRLSYPQQPRYQRQVAAGCEFYDRLTADLSVVETWRGAGSLNTGAWLSACRSPAEDEPRDRNGGQKRSIHGTIYSFRFSSRHQRLLFIRRASACFPEGGCLVHRRTIGIFSYWRLVRVSCKGEVNIRSPHPPGIPIFVSHLRTNFFVREGDDKFFDSA